MPWRETNAAGDDVETVASAWRTNAAGDDVEVVTRAWITNPAGDGVELFYSRDPITDTFDASGTWTKRPGIVRAVVKGLHGGGGGGGPGNPGALEGQVAVGVDHLSMRLAETVLIPCLINCR